MSHSLRLHRLYSPWNSPGQNTGVGSFSLLQGIFPIETETPLPTEISFISVNVSHRRVSSTLSSEFLLCLFLKKKKKKKNQLTTIFCERGLFCSDTLCYPFILFYFCIFEMFFKIYRKKKFYRKQLTVL